MLEEIAAFGQHSGSECLKHWLCTQQQGELKFDKYSLKPSSTINSGAALGEVDVASGSSRRRQSRRRDLRADVRKVADVVDDGGQFR